MLDFLRIVRDAFAHDMALARVAGWSLFRLTPTVADVQRLDKEIRRHLRVGCVRCESLFCHLDTE